MKIKVFLLIISVIFFLQSCKKDLNKSNFDTQVKDSEELVMKKTFYLVPSPEDVFGFANEKSLKFIPELLNPIDNYNKYNDQFLQEFNFGVYSADLAYSAASNRNEETVKYLNVVRKLSQQIGLSDVFNESLIYRIEHVSPIKDSLISLSNDTYFDVLRYLEKTNRESTLAIMAAGGWLESMYLVVSQVEFNNYQSVIQKIADQKYIISNLWKLLEQNQKDKNIEKLMKELKPVYDAYEVLQVIIDENLKKIKENDKMLVIGGNMRVAMNEDEFQNIKENIIKVRNILTLNNVK